MSWAAILLVAAAGPATAAFPGKDGLIAFKRTLKNKKTSGFADRIMTAQPNGKRLNGLTPRCCRLDEDPDWSPNGKRIAFSAFPPRGRIHTINKKGKGPGR